MLADLGADVAAAKPDEAILAELRRRVPSARALHSRAEAIPVGDGSVSRCFYTDRARRGCVVESTRGYRD